MKTAEKKNCEIGEIGPSAKKVPNLHITYFIRYVFETNIFFSGERAGSVRPPAKSTHLGYLYFDR